jgi:hypothetical protein
MGNHGAKFFLDHFLSFMQLIIADVFKVFRVDLKRARHIFDYNLRLLFAFEFLIKSTLFSHPPLLIFNVFFFLFLFTFLKKLFL